MDADPRSMRESPRLVMPAEYTVGGLPTGAAKRAVEVLGQRIVNDVYRPDATMPTETELASSLGVSRTTVRDAVKVLSGKGLVRTARRYGTRVRPVAEWNILDGDVVSWHALGHPRIRQMFIETTELRTMLEPPAAALAAERASPEQVKSILQASRAITPGAAEIQTVFAADCRFHVTLLDATQNAVMRQLAKIIVTMLRVSYEFGVMIADEDGLSGEAHVTVADAIAARDAQAAEAAMREMLSQNIRIADHFRTSF